MKLRLRIEHQFLLLCVITLSLIGLVIDLSLARVIRNNFIEDRKKVLVMFINSQAVQHLTEDMFLSPDLERSSPHFEEFFQGIYSDEVIRIKLYDQNLRVIFSDEKELIGKQFADNREAREALNGKVETEIEKPVKKEHVFEKGYKQLMEIYLPVYFSGNFPSGVAEVYYRLDELNSQLNTLHFFVAGIISLSFVLLVLGLFWLFHRASTQIELYHEREEARLREIASLKDEFVFVAAHELQTPVTLIRGYVDFILRGKGKLSEETRENLTNIDEVNKNLFSLVKNLLDTARSETGKLKITESSVNIKEVVSSVLTDLQSMAAKNNIQLVYNSKVGEAMVFADSVKLKEVLLNLVGNAIKYNKPAGKVTITHELANGFLITQVSDTGIGLSQEDQKHIFEKFWRSEDPSVRKILGTGLGLFITKELLILMRGKIWVNSTVGLGTVFSFTLPLV